jgi:pentatricopeptide repeat protein
MIVTQGRVDLLLLKGLLLVLAVALTALPLSQAHTLTFTVCMHAHTLQMRREGVTPNVWTYNLLIAATHDPQQARFLFADMTAAGIQPDVVTYTSLMSALHKGGESSAALEMIDTMRAAGLQPNAHTFAAAVNIAGTSKVRTQM